MNQVPCAWFATDVEPLDETTLKISKGESASQAALESLALLVGLRAWPHYWKEEKTLVLTRSDALAALGALLKRSSPAGPVNTVMQEIALDCADGTCEVEVVSHIPGALNDWADSLSRLTAPGKDKKEIPFELLHVERTRVEGRSRGWWKTLEGEDEA